MRRNLLSLVTLLAAPLALTACAGDELDELGAPLEAEDSDGDTDLHGMDELATQRGNEAVPGFAVQIGVNGDDVVFDWNAAGIPIDQGPVADIFLILRSEEPSDLIEVSTSDFDFCDGSSEPSFDILEPGYDAFYVDTGAASQTTATPTYFYRVMRIFESPGANSCDVGIGETSTLLAKVSTETAPGYVNFGLCMLDGPSVASQMAAQVGDSVVSVHAWNEQTQSWLWYWTADGSGPFGDFDLPFGGMVTVNLDADAPAYVSMVGTVPTDEAGLEPVEGINHLTTPLLTASMLADSASGYVDDLSWYEGVGVWDVQTQSSNWYYGPGDGDFGLDACRPYKFQGTPDSCTSDAECNDGQYCAFDVTDSCGDAGAGSCTPIPLGCNPEPDPVCGCDGVTYANSCEAQLAGASVASVGACESDYASACLCSDHPAWSSMLDEAADGVVDEPAACIGAPGQLFAGREGAEFGLAAGDDGVSCMAFHDEHGMVQVLLSSDEEIDACVQDVYDYADAAGVGC